MRTTAFVTTLFAVSLCAGAALAEKPHVDRARTHGDMVDKSYRVSHVQRSTPQAPQRFGNATNPIRANGASRISCSETGVDCHTGRSVTPSARAAGMETSTGAGRASRAPAFLDKVLGSDRTNFNENGDDQGMGRRAAQRAWSHAGAGAAGGAAAAHHTLSHQAQRERTDSQASTNRVSCNEGDQCMASSKTSKKEWSYQSVKAGTWSGPEAKTVSPAAVAIAKHNAELARKDADKNDSGQRATKAHQPGAGQVQSVSK